MRRSLNSRGPHHARFTIATIASLCHALATEPNPRTGSGAIAFFAAAESAAVDDRARITPLRQEQLQERLGERFRELDVPLLVEWPDGRREAIVFVLEEESRSRRFDIYRLAHYCPDLAVLCGTDRVVPVVIFLDEGEAAEELCLGGDRHRYLEFRYLACRLARLAYKDYRDSDNLVARLNLPNMHWQSQAEELDALAAAVRGLADLEPDPERRLKYTDFLDIYGKLTSEEEVEYRRRYPEEDEAMTGYFQQIREQAEQKGIQKGMQQGMERGIQQGEAALLLRQLERKFGADAAANHRARVEQADTDTLLEWSERILTAKTIDDVIH